MRGPLRWSYALNAWKPRMDAFVRIEEHERALRTVSVLGFDAVELTAGSGRWETIGRPEVIAMSHGDAAGFLTFVRAAALSGVSSMMWDPAVPAEEEGRVRRDVTAPEDRAGICDAAVPFLEFLAATGGEQLVVRPAPSAWVAGLLDSDAIGRIGDLWNAVGRRAQDHGIGVALHVDCLSSVRTVDHIEALLAATDPELVGIALDTAEFTVAGIDPVVFYRAHADRVTHVHLKDALHVDAGEEFLLPQAETAMLRGGGGRRIERWFCELGSEGGLVDVPGFVGALSEHGYPGWVVVETDPVDDPAESAMLNSYRLQRELGLARR